MEQRKADHIAMALQAQVTAAAHDDRFHYEPLLNPHPVKKSLPVEFLGKQLRFPIWVSSMTGGTRGATEINTNLAGICREFGLGMGLGSCRVLLENSDYLADFNVRPVIGDSLPLYANLGISQVEQYLLSHKVQKIVDLVNRLSADGLIIHVNPLQEWFQPGGDILSQPPIETIRQLVETVNFPVIVKEVGQGMGPASLEALLKLPVAAVEFAAFGGTNFSQIELKRGEPGAREAYYPFIGVGEPAGDMVGYVNELLDGELTHSRCQFIVSGGIRDFLDGYYLIRRLRSKAVYGQASAFLRHAMAGYEELYQYVHQQVQGLLLANAYLTVK